MTVSFVQNHFHIGPYDPGHLTGLHEPDYKIYHQIKPTWIPIIAGTIKRSWTSAPSLHAVLDGSGNPVVIKNKKIQIRIDLPTYDNLLALLYKPVYYVDVRHCADGLDHAPYLTQYALTDISHDDNLDPVLAFIICTIALEDFTTVPPI